jgi:hypothetical protein
LRRKICANAIRLKNSGFSVTQAAKCARCERSGVNLCSAQFLGAYRESRWDYSRAGPSRPRAKTFQKNFCMF